MTLAAIGQSRHTRQVLAFLVVGGVAYVAEVGTFNLLVYGGRDGSALLSERPLTAKGIAILVSTMVAFIGNRYWTFRQRDRRRVARQITSFVSVNVLAFVLAILPLAVSRYVLGLSGPVPDNVSANIIGVTIATVFRFWAYGRYVFVRVEQPRPKLRLLGRGDS